MDKQDLQHTYITKLQHAAEETDIIEASHGLPSQRLPGFIRGSLKAFALFFILIDQAAQGLARKIVPPPFVKAGSCLRRGRCCRFILMPEPKGIIGRIFYLWQVEINGFYHKETSPADEKGDRLYVMGCRHLKKDGSCASYRTRPALCRRWPIIEVFGRPRLFKGCGYRVVDRKSGKELTDQELP
jgi:Fe-S-cluster containining protein